MEGNRSSQDEINSFAYSEKKRKLQHELLEMPLPKHICRDQYLEQDSLSHSNTEPKKVESDEFSRGSESDPESTKSNSLNCNSDSIMSIDDETKTDLEYPDTCSSDDRFTSSATLAGTSSEASLNSSENRSSTNPNSSESESLSMGKQPDCPHHQYEGRFVEFGSNADFSFSIYGNAGVEQCTDKELENQLYSNGVAPSSNYVLSSGRWSVSQDTQQEGKKLTIDKEFEQYFAMLML